MKNDRTIHAECGGDVLVRYDRAGKWYHEQPGSGRRRVVSIAEAVAIAQTWRDHRRPAGTTYYGRSGGKRFDTLMQRSSYPPSPVRVGGPE